MKVSNYGDDDVEEELCAMICSAGNVLKTNASSVNTALGSMAARRPPTTDTGGTSLWKSWNITSKSGADSSLCQSPAFAPDEFDDDFEPMPLCKLF